MTASNVTSLAYNVNDVSIREILLSIHTSDDPTYTLLLACDSQCVEDVLQTVTPVLFMYMNMYLYMYLTVCTCM